MMNQVIGKSIRSKKGTVKARLRNLRIFVNLIRLREFLKGLDMKLAYFVVPAALSLLSALFEGIGIGLLVPMMKGMIERDFSFIREAPLLGDLMERFPSSWMVDRPNACSFLLIVGIVFSAWVIKNVLAYAASLTVTYEIEKFSSNLRKILFGRYLGFGKLFFDKTNTGYLHTVLITFTTELSLVLRHTHMMLGEFFMLAVYLLLMFILSWKLAIFSLIVFPILHYSLSWLVKKVEATSRSFAVANQNLGSDIFNTLSCIPLVKAYSKEGMEKKKFARASDLVAQIQVSMFKKTNLVTPLQEIITLAALLILVASMAFVIVREKAAEVSGLLVFFFLIRRAMGTFGVLNRIRFYLARVSGPLARIEQMRSDKDKFYVVEGKKEFDGFRREIEFRHMDYSYVSGVPVLKDLSYSIERGKMVAIVGPTGAGKTTIINLIMRFYDCASGSLFIDGTDIREFTLESLRKHMAFISQEVLLFNDTLKANVTYGMDGKISEEKIMNVMRKAQLYDFVEKLPEGLGTSIGDRGIRLSGGEKQRVSIARALLKESEVLILDEATSALDSRTERLIQSAIDEAVKGRTSIVIAHRLSTIKHADKIVVIEDGQLMEEGRLPELLDKKGKFHAYWEEQKFF